MQIIGLDPGVNKYGIAKIFYERKPMKPQITVTNVKSLVLFINKKETREEAFKKYFDGINGYLHQYTDYVAIETVYLGKNVRTLIQLAEVRGIGILLASLNNIPVIDMPPMEMKYIVTGSRKASKAIVAKIICKTLHLDEKKMENEFGKYLYDATDALGLAYAGARREALAEWKKEMKEK